MKSLILDDELRKVLSDLEYDIPNVHVIAEYELTDDTDIPVVTYAEMHNTIVDHITADDGIAESRTDVAYTISVFARDCVTNDGTVIPRDAATMSMADTVCHGMFKRYGWSRDDMSPSYPVDSTCNTQVVRFRGVIDDYDYTYSR